MNVLLAGDTLRMPELRHEVPLGIPDLFFYAEVNGSRVVAISSMEADRVAALVTGLDVRPLEEFGADELRRSGLDRNTYLDQLAVRIAKGLGLESAVVPRSFPLGIAGALQASGVELRCDQDVFDDRRRRKSGHELAGIRRAQAATQAAMGLVRDLLRRSQPSGEGRKLDGEPLTCELLKARVRGELLARGAFSSELIVSHGAQTAIGHEEGSGPIAADDVVLVDIFPVDLESGCYADMTRTFAVGDPPDEIRQWHADCREALALATGEVRPGADGAGVHRLVSELLAERGHPTQLTKKEGEVLRDGFYHALGHGVGLEAHERPWMGLHGDELVAGDVVALEPGLYRAGYGGVRIEDLVLVTEDGCEVLTDFPYDLEV